MKGRSSRRVGWAAMALLLATLGPKASAGPPVAQAATPLAALAASMAPGTWAELSTNGFGGGAILSTDSPPGSDYITQYADSAAWDPVGQRVLFLGVPHGSMQQPWRFIIYTAGDNTWRTGPLPLS